MVVSMKFCKKCHKMVREVIEGPLDVFRVFGCTTEPKLVGDAASRVRATIPDISEKRHNREVVRKLEKMRDVTTEGL